MVNMRGSLQVLNVTLISPQGTLNSLKLHPMKVVEHVGRCAPDTENDHGGSCHTWTCGGVGGEATKNERLMQIP